MHGEDLSIQGSLSEASLPELLASISRSRETGVLNFHDMGRWKAIYFKDGKIIFATSNLPDDRLGEFLLKGGKITVRQYLDSSKLIKPGKRLGAVLVEQSILSPDELFVAIKEHVEEMVYSLFEWSRGEYEFVMKELAPSEGPVSLDLCTEKVILEGIRRLRDFTRVYSGVGSVDTILRQTDIADGLVYKLELDEDESQILSQVNGRLTVEQILSMSYLSNFETLRILYGMVAAGVLVRGATESPTRVVEMEYELEEIVDYYNRNFGTVCSYLGRKLGDKAGEFADETVAKVSELFPVLFESIELGSAGRVDFDQILANLGDKPHEQKKAVLVEGLNELTYGLLLEIGHRFGKDEQERVATSILSQGPPPGTVGG